VSSIQGVVTGADGSPSPLAALGNQRVTFRLAVHGIGTLPSCTSAN
jgi:hypothetical protein